MKTAEARQPVHIGKPGGPLNDSTPEGLVLLKLYALPSLYRQGDVSRAAFYETDILTLMHDHRVDPEPLFAELEPHLSATDLKALRQIVAEIRQRIERSGSRFAG